MNLIDYIISKNNKSGSIPPAPNALKDLKAAIEGIPFELKQPGMSGLFNMNNLLQGLQKLQQQMGSLENIGSFQQILQQIKDGTVTFQQLENALGSGGSLAAVLMNYKNGATPPTQITSTDLVIPNTNEADVGPLFYTKNQVDAAFYDREDIDNFIDPMNTAIANNTLAIANNAAAIANNTTAISNINTSLANVVHYDANTKITANGYSTFQGAAYNQYGTNLKFRGEEFEWGHLNQGGYGSVLGFEINTGKPYIAFGGGRGSSTNTYRTFGPLTGGIIRANLDGSMTFGYLTANTDNQTLTPSFVTSTGTNYSWGHLNPAVTATYDLGSNAARWGTVYTSDLDLSNGIGDYTIVEGENDLFLYNNKQNKVYKFALIEVDPSDATPKKINAD